MAHEHGMRPLGPRWLSPRAEQPGLAVTPEQLRRSVREVVEYLWDDEGHDYIDAPDEPGRHIFEHLFILRRWLEQGETDDGKPDIDTRSTEGRGTDHFREGRTGRGTEEEAQEEAAAGDDLAKRPG